jgi:hypothetical protein
MQNRVSETRFHEIVLRKHDFMKSGFGNTILGKIPKKKNFTGQAPRRLKSCYGNTILTAKIVGSRHDFKKRLLCSIISKQ